MEICAGSAKAAWGCCHQTSALKTEGMLNSWALYFVMIWSKSLRSLVCVECHCQNK